MMDKIKETLVNKWTLGGSLLVVGVGTLATVPMSKTLNRVWFSLPIIGYDVTILRFMGLLTTTLGVAVLTRYDPLDVKREV
jgi:hypothetical protein